MVSKCAWASLILAAACVLQSPRVTHLHFHLPADATQRDLQALFDSTPLVYPDDGISAVGAPVVRAAEPLKSVVRGEAPALQKYAARASRLSRRRARRQGASHKHVFDVMNQMVGEYESLTPDERTQIQSMVKEWETTGRPPSLSSIPPSLVQNAVTASVGALSRYGTHSVAPAA